VLGGQVLTWLDASGAKVKTVFKVDGRLTAVQYSYGGSNYLTWTHIDPLEMSEAGDTKPVYDPLGNLVTWQHVPSGPPPNAYPPSAASYGGLAPSFGYAINSSCILDGIPTDCNLAMNMLTHGSAEQCPNNYCGAGRARNGDLVPLTRDPDTGLLGYFPTPEHTKNSAEQGKPTLQDIKNALNECIDLLWGEDGHLKFTLDTFDPTNAKANGSATFSLTRGLENPVQTGQITNSVEYSRQDLYLINTLNNGEPYYIAHEQWGSVNGTTFTRAGYYLTSGNGDTKFFTPYVNYTANNPRGQQAFSQLQAAIGDFVYVQIHELGNSIAAITGKNVGKEGAKDTDSGYQLDGCVARKLSGGW
jgi:hypothetical protein